MKIILSIVLLCNTLCAFPIVFVHVGPQLPDYLLVALDQASLFNPDSEIYLICNQPALSTWTPPPYVRSITCESLTQSFKHRLFLASTGLNKRALEGFWVYASERFFYLEELIEQYKLTDVFHLENDVMLYVSLSDILPVFHDHYRNQIAATFDSDTRCVPGFMYISSLEPIAQLTHLMAKRASSGKNDMEILNEFRTFHNGEYIAPLPIVFPSYAKDYGLCNQLGHKAQSPDLYWKYFSDFKSIFDAAAIGQYLGGISPRNGVAVPGFINETTYFNPSDFTYIWEEDEKNRRRPFLLYHQEKYPINNLHIHCKILQPFHSLRTL